MSVLHKLFRSLRGVFQKRAIDQAMDDEMRLHIEMQTRDNIAAGMSPEEAATVACRQFGRVEAIKESCRDQRLTSWLENLARDVAFAFRQLGKNPGFTAVAVISLALGIAANSTIFSFVNTLLLSPPPVGEPNELWQIWRLNAKPASELKRYQVWSRREIAYLREHNQLFTGIGAFEFEPQFTTWNRNGTGESVQSLLVSGNFFDLCLIKPALGRFFQPSEDRTPGTHPVVVVSYGFWQRQLAADAHAIGQTLMINGTSLTVIGVAPKEFKGLVAGISPDLWVPFMMAPSVLRDADWLTRIDSHSVAGLGRLKPGVEMAQGAAELTLLTRRFEEEIHGPDLQDGAILTPSLMVPVLLRGFVRAFTGTLMGAVFLVLLIACANAANLQLARAVTRRQEMAVRSALGAKRGRLIRQLLTESVVLAALGGGLGLLISLGLTRLAGHLVPATLPIRLAVDLDWRVLSFTAVVSAITGILFGLAPALRGTRMDVADTLKDESRGTAARRSRLAGILIAGQMALCLVLLLSAGLCLRSLLKASAFNPGFEVRERITAGFNLGDFGYSTARAREFYTRLTERVRGLPGVQSAALASFLPLGTEHSNGIFQLEGEKPPGGESGVSFHQFGAGPGYFVTMGTKVLQGREFQETDREGTPRVVIINEEAARRYWPGRNPLGRRIYIGDVRTENAAEIVGIVQTGRYQTLGEDPIPVFYECFDQIDRSRATLVAHVRGNSQLGLAAIRRVTLELDPRLALIGATTLEQHLSLALFPVRTSSLLLGVLGMVALVLAVSGLFGVVAYSVSQRTREFGIRLALGAQRHDVLRLVLGQGLKLAAWGIVAGLFGAVGASHLLRNLLFAVGPLDPATFLAVPPLLLAVAWLACLIPALRASSLPPMTALRRE